MTEQTLEEAWPFLLGENWGSRIGQHLSASSITQFWRCPEQFRRVYLQNERRAPSAALVVGSADHEAHSVNFTQKIDTGEDLPTSDVLDAFHDAWAKSIDRNGGESEIEWDEKPHVIYDRHVHAVANYHEMVSPLVEPIAVEKKLVRFIEGCPVPVIGYADVMTERSVIERKTANRTERGPKQEWRVQGLIYMAETGKSVNWHVVNKKTAEVTTALDWPALHMPYQQSSIDQFVVQTAQTMADYLRRYGPDEPWPGAIAMPTWACGYCGFRSTCNWWKHERKGGQ